MARLSRQNRARQYYGFDAYLGGIVTNTITVDIQSYIAFQATLKADELARNEIAASEQTNGYGKIEFGGSSASARFPIDWTATTRIDALGPITIGATLNADIASNDDFAVGQVVSVRSPLEYETRLYSNVRNPIDDQASELISARAPIDFGDLLQTTYRTPLEFSVSERLDAVSPIDFGNSLKADNVAPIAFQATLNADALSREDNQATNNVGIRSYADFGVTEQGTFRSSIDFGVSELASFRTPLEFENSLYSNVRAPIEWTGVIQVTIDCKAPIAILSTLNADAASPIADIATLLMSARTPIVISATLFNNIRTRLEELSSVAVDDIARIEFGGSSASARFPIEILSSERNEMFSPVEWGASGNVVVITGRAPIAWLATFNSDILSQPATQATLQQNARTQLDYSGTFVSSYRGRIDWQQSLRADAVLPMARLASLYGDALANIEINGDQSGARFGINPQYLTLANGRKVLISPVARVYHIVPVARTKGN